MNAAELATYDQIKSFFLRRMPNANSDSKKLHFVCGFVAGFIAVCFASPMDVVKTRMMNVFIIFNINRALVNIQEW